MAQNLNYEVENSGCTEGDDCSKVGRLYDWAQVMEFSSTYNNATASSLIKTPHRGICPTNYHVPTNSEWQTLHNYVANQSGVTSVTTELNAHTGWATTGYSDSFGFSMIPMGAVKSGNGRAAFWTSTELSSIRSNRWFKDYTNNPYSGYTFSNTISDPKTSTMLLRCLKD